MSLTKEEKLLEFATKLAEHSKSGTAGAFLGIDNHFYEDVEQRAYKLYKSGYYDKAIVLLLGLVDLDAKRPYPFSLLADCYFREGSYDKALEFFAKAHELDESNTVLMCKLGETKLRLGDKEEAKAFFEKTLEHSNNTSRSTIRARALLNTLEALAS